MTICIISSSLQVFIQFWQLFIQKDVRKIILIDFVYTFNTFMKMWEFSKNIFVA